MEFFPPFCGFHLVKYFMAPAKESRIESYSVVFDASQ
mgnify:CR=1 FL=1